MIHPLNFYNENDEIVLKEPCIGTKAFVAETATLIGDVSLGEDVSIWYNTVLRGDVMPIEIGARSNIQDQCMLHGTFKQFAVKIGEEVTVGHGVTLHGCTIEDQCFIGMDSTIMDGVHIEKNCFVAAGSLLSPGKRFPSGSMIMGRPAKVVRELTDKEYKEFVASYKRYVKYKDCYLNNQTNEK